MCDQESVSIIRETGRREVNNNSIGGLERGNACWFLKTGCREQPRRRPIRQENSMEIQRSRFPRRRDTTGQTRLRNSRLGAENLPLGLPLSSVSGMESFPRAFTLGLITTVFHPSLNFFA